MQSAIGYCQAAGLAVQAANRDGFLILTIANAYYVTNGTSAEFRIGTPNPPDNGTPFAGVASIPPDEVAQKRGPGMTKKAILYARSATGENDAIARQLEACQRWAEEHGYVVHKEYSEGTSGLVAELLARKQAVHRAESEGAALICIGPSRLTRNTKLLISIMIVCNQQRMTVIFTDAER